MAQTATDANRTIERIASTIGELPSSPAIVSAVMGLTSNLDADVSDISRVMATDQSLTAKVLKLSNSSFYGRSKQVSSLQEAILILGFYTVRSIVVATSTRSMFEDKDPESPQSKLWRHSLSSAIASRQIAAHVRHPSKDAIFIAALLHDIGKLVLLKNLGSQYVELVDKIEAAKDTFVRAEEEQLGFTHAEVASVLLEKWSFPNNLTEAVFKHHELPPYEGEGPVPTAYVINLGNHLAKRLQVGFHDLLIEDLSSLDSAQAMGLDEAALEELLAQTQEFYEAEAGIFEGH